MPEEKEFFELSTHTQELSKTKTNPPEGLIETSKMLAVLSLQGKPGFLHQLPVPLPVHGLLISGQTSQQLRINVQKS